MDTPDSSNSNSTPGYSVAQVSEFLDTIRKLRNAQPSVVLDLSALAEQLTSPRARTFANEGLGRRLRVIERAVLNVYRIYPPDRQKFLTNDECNDVAIQLHAFAINLYALFDNIVWVCTQESGKQLPPLKIGPFKPECQESIPAALKEYLAQPTVQTWFHDYGKMYRDSTAHRIAPYLPTRVYTTEEGARWHALHTESMSQLLGVRTAESKQQIDDRLARHEQLENEKELIGRNSQMIGLSLTGEDASPPVYLHPQLLCDWGLAHELILAFTSAMRQQYGWKQPNIPQVVVQ